MENNKHTPIDTSSIEQEIRDKIADVKNELALRFSKQTRRVMLILGCCFLAFVVYSYINFAVKDRKYEIERKSDTKLFEDQINRLNAENSLKNAQVDSINLRIDSINQNIVAIRIQSESLKSKLNKSIKSHEKEMENFKHATIQELDNFFADYPVTE